MTDKEKMIKKERSTKKTACHCSLVLTTTLFLFFSLFADQRFKENLSRSLGFTLLRTSPMVPIPVLMVYPAQNPAFQQGVVALAEFLQWHGGCNVSVDMWQQGKIAKLGPMRWLAEQVKAADRVLIVCPQVKIVSCLDNLCLYGLEGF